MRSSKGYAHTSGPAGGGQRRNYTTKTVRLQGKRGLSAYEREVMQSVSQGADVWGYLEASTLRSIKRRFPEYVQIVQAMEKPSGEKRQPYFGAILTVAGRKALL